MKDDIDKTRQLDKVHYLVKENSRKMVSVEQIKSLYIAEGLSAEEIANTVGLPVLKIQDLVESHNLPELRNAYIIQGIKEIQNKQVQQAHKLLDIENNFKKLRILQLEEELKSYVAYYQRHGHFYKVHPVSGEILKDTNGIPLQIKIPNVSKEIGQLKESVTVSEGVKGVLNQLDSIINTGPKVETIYDDNIIEADYSTLFNPNISQEELKSNDED